MMERLDRHEQDRVIDAVQYAIRARVAEEQRMNYTSESAWLAGWRAIDNKISCHRSDSEYRVVQGLKA